MHLLLDHAMLNSKNIVFHELIGLTVGVISSPNYYEVGLKGEVIRETRNMLFISSPITGTPGDKKGNNIKVHKIAKSHRVFAFYLNGKIIKVLGDVLVGRGEERLKNKKIKMRRVLNGEMLNFVDSNN